MSLQVNFRVPAKDPCVEPGVDILPGHLYRFIVEGTWIDYHDAPVGVGGNLHPGGIRERLGWAKRLSTAPWMALLIRVKGGDGTSAWCMLGKQDSIWSNLPPGKLQLCANDVKGFYFNNSGELHVTLVDVTGLAELETNNLPFDFRNANR